MIVALDSSGKSAGVCMMEPDGTILYEKTLNLGLTHSETLLPMLQKAFDETGRGVRDVRQWAVTAGPGSFTGLRIGMALVKGLAAPHGQPVAAVSTLEALAVASGLEGVVIPALDARRSEVYWAAFSGGEDRRRLLPDSAGPVEEIASFLESAEGPVFFVGDGAEICYNIYNYGPKVAKALLPNGIPIAKGAAILALRSFLAGETPPASAARPQYLRLSQAERERANREAAGQNG